MRVLLGMRLALTSAGTLLAMLAAAVLGYDSQMVIGAGLMGVGLIFVVVYSTLSIPLAADIRMGAVTGLDVGRQVSLAVLFVVLVAAGSGVRRLPRGDDPGASRAGPRHAGPRARPRAVAAEL